MVSEQAVSGPGTEGWKVGASQAVVAVVTVLDGEIRMSRVLVGESLFGLTRRRCTRRVRGHHCLRRWAEGCRHFEAGSRWILVSGCQAKIRADLLNKVRNMPV